MGIGFVVLLHLIALFLLGIVIAIVAGISTYFFSSKVNRKRKILLALISPFIGLSSLYFCWLFGSIVVSSFKNVDIGIGDAWYVPLSDNSKLLFIDTWDQAFIKNGNQTVVSEVSRIHHGDHTILVNTNENKFVSFDTRTNELKEYTTEDELMSQNFNRRPELIDATEFYHIKRNEIVGIWSLIVSILSVVISITIIYLFKRLII